EQRKKGKKVPCFEKDFFTKFAASEVPFVVDFSPEHLSFAHTFLEEVAASMEKEGLDATPVLFFLTSFEEYGTGAHTVQ
ncbi:MAG: hypothetical protein ACYCZ7_00995, partial [Minisyncoccota bacterium]